MSARTHIPAVCTLQSNPVSVPVTRSLFAGASRMKAGIDWGEGFGQGALSRDTLSGEERRELISAVREGRVLGLRVEILAYIDKPNANGYRPHNSELGSLADDADGGHLPFLTNHHHSLECVKGNLHKGVVVRGGEIGLGGDDAERLCLVLVVDLLEAEFMERYLRRLVNEFSISWSAGRQTCSLCHKTLNEDSGWLRMGCDHLPGRDGCEIISHDTRLIECSAVSRGAVTGTRPLAHHHHNQEASMEDVKSEEVETELPADDEQTDDEQACDEQTEDERTEDAPAPEHVLAHAALSHELAEVRRENQGLVEKLACALVDIAIHEKKLEPKTRDFWLSEGRRNIGLLERYLESASPMPRLADPVLSQPAPQPDKGARPVGLLQRLADRGLIKVDS